MRAATSDQLITAIHEITAERSNAARRGWHDDVAVLDEELEQLRLGLLKLRWKETNDASLS